MFWADLRGEAVKETANSVSSLRASRCSGKGGPCLSVGCVVLTDFLGGPRQRKAVRKRKLESLSLRIGTYLLNVSVTAHRCGRGSCKAPFSFC